MLQLHPVYSLWNRCKTLTGSPDPTCANGTNKPCITIKIAKNQRVNNHFGGLSISPRLNKEAANPYKMIFFTSAGLKFSKFWTKVALNQ